MSRYFCHDHPDVLGLETRVLDARPGAVVLEQSPFHPGGGGQLADRGRLAWYSGETTITGFEVAEDGRVWHRLAEPVEIAGAVQASVDASFRALQTELHTNAHVLNALVFQHCTPQLAAFRRAAHSARRIDHAVRRDVVGADRHGPADLAGAVG